MFCRLQRGMSAAQAQKVRSSGPGGGSGGQQPFRLRIGSCARNDSMSMLTCRGGLSSSGNKDTNHSNKWKHAWLHFKTSYEFIGTLSSYFSLVVSNFCQGICS